MQKLVFLVILNIHLFIKYGTGIKCFSADSNFDIMYIQDLSSSYNDDREAMHTEVSKLFREVKREFNNSRFAMSTFTDRPFYPFGYEDRGDGYFEGDWCVRMESSFTSEENIQETLQAVIDGPAGGGKDFPEAQLIALHDISRGVHVGWRNQEDVINVIVMATDSPYHIAKDADWLRPNNGDFITDCMTENYPTITQVAAAIKDINAFVVFVVGISDAEVNLLEVYDELLQEMGVTGRVVDRARTGSLDLAGLVLQILKDSVDICEEGSLLFLQDSSHSMLKDEQYFENSIRTVIKNSLEFTPNLNFGFATFSDKPLDPMGYENSGDHCYKLLAPMEKHNYKSLMRRVGNIPTNSGQDWPEAQMEAVVKAAMDLNVNWKGKKTIVVFTNSGFHQPNDGLNYDNLEDWTPQGGCDSKAYPTLEQVASVLRTYQVEELIFIVSNETHLISIYEEAGKKILETYPEIFFISNSLEGVYSGDS